MKKLILLSVLLLSVTVSYSQNISGKVSDKNNNPVEFATVVLQSPDSVYISSTYTDSLGMFYFDSSLSSCRLIVQHLIYNMFEGEYPVGEPIHISLEDNEHALSEVVVKGERPVVSVVNGRMTYDMPHLLEKKVVSSAYEALMQLPGVSEYDEKISLAGASSLAVVINGKPTTMTSQQLMELLKNMPKERIQKAEVMYSAPPEYHVRGAAINLILDKGVSENNSLQGEVNTRYRQRYYESYNGGVTLLYNHSKFSTDFMYSYGYAKHHTAFDLYSYHPVKGQINEITQYNSGYMEIPVHNIRLGNDLYLGANNTLSFVYTGQINPRKESLQLSNGTYSESENLKKSADPTQMHSVEMRYSSNFGLNAGIDYTYYKNNETQYYEEKMTGKESLFTSPSQQNINRLSVYADQKHEINNGWSLSYGAKFIYATDKSSQKYQALTEKQLPPDTYTKINEYTSNLYIGLKKDLSEKFSLSASLTGEYYKYNDFDEWTLFPALEATYMNSPEHIFQMSVSTDKQYATYGEMINSISYLNGYTEVHGNPRLRPYKNYSMQLSYIHKSKYIVTAYANYLDDFFSQLPYQAPDRVALIYQTLNFDYVTKMGLNVVIPFRISNVVDSRLVLNGFYEKAKSSHFHDTTFDKDNFAVYSNFTNTFNISNKPNIKAELSATYISGSIQGPSEFSKMYMIDAGVKWLFANDKAELSFKANDIFNKWSPERWTMKFDDRNLRMHLVPDSRCISVSFTYKFGNYKDKNRTSVDTSRFAK